MSTSIIVLTHNGKLPKDGGLRLGYQCGDNVRLFSDPSRVYSARQLEAERKAERKRQERAASTIQYASLPTAHYFDGECTKCKAFPNESQDVMTTTGLKPIITCSKCGNQMKPKPRAKSGFF